jgi:2-polyprenyl-3-methyl-5-hydroxy-6-metoxy-1,4-benzoquinol methylase
MSNYKEIRTCVACGSSDLHPYLDLGNQPLANSYHKGEKLNTYPLHVQYCKSCTHNMLTVSVDPSEMFEHYLYISDTSQTLTDYFQGLCDKILDRNKEVEKPRVLEIACNSGLFLEMFKNDGCDVYGVDPAKNLRELSEARGLDVSVKFWDLTEAADLATKKVFDIVVAIHVFPHVPDPVSFLKACHCVLAPEGKIYIQTSQCDMFKNKEFDAVYHEHVSYFTAKSFGKIVESLGMFVTGSWKAPIHSMSFVFEISNVGPHCHEFLQLVKEEEERGMDKSETFDKFAADVNKIKTDLVAKCQEYRDKGMKVVGYGASAKGNTLLNWMGIPLDYIVDDNRLKWEYLTPGTDIPILSPSILYEETEPVAIVCLAWNFFDEIHKNVLNNSTIKHDFIQYFPEVKVSN